MHFDLTTPPKILVLGDVMIDEYFVGSVHRMSPEAPVPVVNVSNHFFRLGGAGNVINNLKSLGAYVDVIGVIGECDASDVFINELGRLGCSTRYLMLDKNRIMPKKSRVLSGTQQLVRYDIEETAPLSEMVVQKIRDCFLDIIDRFDLVILSDYAKGFLTQDLTKFLIRESQAVGVPVLVDPKGQDYTKYIGAYCITPNKKELELMYGAEIMNRDNLTAALDRLKQVAGVEIAMVTLSEEGIAFKQDELKISKTKARAIADVTGAGDTVIAALGFCFAVGKNATDAVEFANYAAGLVVEIPGVATVTHENVLRFKKASELGEPSKKLELSELASVGKLLRSDGKKIVFTNGCFDILHVGHMDYLRRSKQLGDVLIVGINSDGSVKRLKGASRPINVEEDRASLIAALSFVDYVTIFEDDTPITSIELLRPNIITKGEDWSVDQVAGRELVDEVCLLPYLEGKSTTNLIKEIGSNIES